jgi:cytochrome c biogenesis protein CcmG/thiol:disulfide interchange protein DsbE
VRRVALVLPLVAVFVIAGLTLFRTTTGRVGRPAPQFSLPDIADPYRTIGLASLRGKPVVLNFWASWCDPCRAEAPELARTARQYTASVRFLGMAILDGRDAGLAYMARYKVPYESVRDARGTVSKLFGVTGVPETVFIDARGVIVGHYIGAFTRGQLGPIVAELISLRPGEKIEISGRGETRPVP